MRRKTLASKAGCALGAAVLAGVMARPAAQVSQPGSTGATFALIGGTVMAGDGRTLPGATVVVRDGVIEAVGDRVKVPAGVTTIDAKGGDGMRTPGGLFTQRREQVDGGCRR